MSRQYSILPSPVSSKTHHLRPLLIMQLIGVLVLSALSSVHGGWLEQLTLDKGLELGSGINLRLEKLKRENSSLLEGHALRLDYSGLGLRLAKAPNKDVIQVGLYAGDEVEGRKKEEVGEMLIPAVLGFKITGLAAIVFVGVAVLVFKALAVGKLGFLVTLGMLIAKYVHHDEPVSHVEVEHIPVHHPIYPEHHPSATGYSPSGSANYYSYANYGTSGVEGAESSGQFTIVEAPTGNSSAVVVPAGKRHDFLRRKSQPLPFLSVRKYTIEH